MLRKDTKVLYGYIVTSKLRREILEVLYKNSTLRQTEIAVKLNKKQQNISKAVYDLEKERLIECLNPEKSAWKSYMITDLGKEIIRFAKQQKNEVKKRIK